MLSSTIVVFVVLKLLSARALSQLFNRLDRVRCKRDLLRKLRRLGKLSAAEVSSKTTQAVTTFLDHLGGNAPFSPSYVARCVGAGILSATVVVGTSVLFLSTAPVAMFSNVMFWKMIFVPILISAAVFTPIDIGIAHLLARRSVAASPSRFAVIALVSAIVGYGLWCAGTATVSTLGPLITGGYFSWKFILNRFALALKGKRSTNPMIAACLMGWSNALA